MKRLVTALAFVIATSVSAFAQGFPLPSGWQNQRGSDMDLYPASNGNFTGHYFNHAPGFQCQNGPMNPVPYKITGHASGSSVIFNVVWNNGIVELQFSNRMDWNAAGPNAYDEMDSDRTRNQADPRH